MTEIARQVIDATRELSQAAGTLKFGDPVAFVYNPLEYAAKPHEEYLRRFAGTKKRVIFLGMNPGPFGMAQTGIPFGEINAVQNWLGIFDLVGKPPREHPAKPVDGFACRRSEVSGKRFWGLARERYGSAEKFFEEHFVANYCPLLFVAGNKSGKNLTPENLVPAERSAIIGPCDRYLRQIVKILEPDFVVGIGLFAQKAAQRACDGLPVTVTTILHPSPASPAANRDWAGQATSQLVAAGIWRQTAL
ncbi:MAG: single-stranded DNA-binding protein [Opitutales bacterium]|nr:single-stranded DNA-binding protein [Opitutales bacterium]